jgi:hypothetical protein
MRVSKYIKAHKDILLEYIYDDGNNLSEGYNILVNSRDNSNSFVSSESSSSNNTPTNQLFLLDNVTKFYGIVNSSNYGFLQYKEFASGFPIRFDTIKIHLPINYTFGEYVGCYLRIYGVDKFDNQYNLSNFYFDNTDVSFQSMLDFTAPPLKFGEKLWGKYINIEIPSLYTLSRQLSGTAPKTNSINANLTNGIGFSQNSPVFLEFSFLTMKKTISGITNYFANDPYKISVPQTPEFENLGVKIEPSKNGDFFEIYGIYNGSLSDFKTFIDNAKLSGNRYYVEFVITLFEQNIRGKQIKITLTENFNEKVEYRPIIKYTTTTAVIDVEMRLIDFVDDSIIYRRASYGMLQDEVAKYSLNLTKINLSNASKPKIYNLKTPTSVSGGVQFQFEPILVDRTVLVDRYNLIAKSDSVIVGQNVFYGLGKLKILIQPFDNLIQFIIAQDVSTEQTPGINGLGNLSFSKSTQYLDLTNMGEINFVIKNDTLKFETNLYMESNSIDLSRGTVVFKINEANLKEIKRIYDSGQNVFYITSRLNSQTVSIYSGLFEIYDSENNINDLNTQQAEIQRDVLSAEKSAALLDPYSQNTAIVYRRPRTTETAPVVTSESSGVSDSSTPASTKINGITYTITSSSSLIIDGFEWNTSQIKTVLELSSLPTTLSIKTDGLYSSDKFLDTLSSLSKKLVNQFVKTADDKIKYEQTTIEFKKNNP